MTINFNNPSIEPSIASTQTDILSWAIGTFGPIATDPKERAMRVVEEAVELAQAVDVDLKNICVIVLRAYNRPKGQVGQEVGGLMVTLLGFCEAIHLNLWAELRREVERVLSIPRERWVAKHAEKKEAGTAL